ncbi:immunity 26/phosphotriesterase HocA family protein [Marinifilum flexuosum]|uniref:immunity 26/phosphotriesterase HocA family protein n=1 Tax=Marinifilum flexuosum TaxID=1117708 RepID=UPI00248F9AAB|nr:immunity 26/phosphotriesterase HocA family protein [Marinifilum flexuosum]
MFELDNKQRKFFGLDPIADDWDRVDLKSDSHRPNAILYYDKDIIRKHIISTEKIYQETQYNELTQNRESLLPKTKKGKPKKLTVAVLETRTPIGVYLKIFENDELTIGNHTSQNTFYSNKWENRQVKGSVSKLVKEFIDSSPKNHLSDIEKFQHAKRKRINYKSGDFFAFKINRKEYGFGRILLDVNKLRKKKQIDEHHGLNFLMGPPLLIKIYSFISDSKEIDLGFLKTHPSLPSDYIMDNLVFYGDYEIIGNEKLDQSDFDFPMSYGRNIDFSRKTLFLQWGMIHIELPLENFKNKLLKGEEHAGDSNKYGYYSIGFRPKWDTVDLKDTILNDGIFDYAKANHYKTEFDLRNPKNKEKRDEIMRRFGLNPALDYHENAKLSKTKDIIELIKEMN